MLLSRNRSEYDRRKAQLFEAQNGHSEHSVSTQFEAASRSALVLRLPIWLIHHLRLAVEAVRHTS